MFPRATENTVAGPHAAREPVVGPHWLF